MGWWLQEGAPTSTHHVTWETSGVVAERLPDSATVTAAELAGVEELLACTLRTLLQTPSQVAAKRGAEEGTAIEEPLQEGLRSKAARLSWGS